MTRIDFHDISQAVCIRGEGKLHSPTGYLRKSRFNKVHYAHRLAYADANGVIPKGYHVHHLCDNKTCINPKHLIALSPKEHLEIHSLPKAKQFYDNLKTCKRGHPLDGVGIRQRFCLSCHKDASRAWREKPSNREKNNAKSLEGYYRRKAKLNVVY